MYYSLIKLYQLLVATELAQYLVTHNFLPYILPTWYIVNFWEQETMPQCLKLHAVNYTQLEIQCCVQLFVTPWTVGYQASPSIGFSGKSTGVGCHFLLQGIFLTQGLKLGLLHCRQMLYPLSHQGSPQNVIDSNKING